MIQIENTPNPNALKFLSTNKISEIGSKEFQKTFNGINWQGGKGTIKISGNGKIGDGHHRCAILYFLYGCAPYSSKEAEITIIVDHTDLRIRLLRVNFDLNSNFHCNL